MPKKFIVCVCKGNILRSAVAEKLIYVYLRQNHLDHNYQIISRSIQGTRVEPRPVRYPNLTYYGEVYNRVKPFLKELNIDLSEHKSTPIDYSVVTKASVIIAMDIQTHQNLCFLFPLHTHKIHLFSHMANISREICDVPYHTKPTYSIKTVKEIKSILDQSITRILDLAGSIGY